MSTVVEGKIEEAQAIFAVVLLGLPPPPHSYVHNPYIYLGLSCLSEACLSQSIYICRVQSCVWRLPKY
jgi:hypothetical protein